MTGNWKVCAQLSTSHSSLAALDASRMEETVRKVTQAVDLDLLVVGFREGPDIFRWFLSPTRPVRDVFLWYGVLSDIEGMEDSDLVVNWKGERSRGWGGWAGKGAEVEETFRFACPNNPATREKTLRRLRELMSRYAFSGVFLDKIRFPSPANGIDEALSCFCDHCRRAARVAGLNLDAVARILAERAVKLPSLADGSRIEAHRWPETIASADPILSHFLKFRSESIAGLVAELAEAARELGRAVALDLFSPCLSSLVGQDYPRVCRHCAWAKPMTYRIAQGPAGLRLEIPALIEGLARLFNLDERRALDWCARHIQAFEWDLVERTREEAVPLRFIEAEIEAAVRATHPVPVYFGLELVSQPGVIDVTPADVRAMVGAGRAANAAGLVISWDLMHAPMDGVEALAEAIGRPFGG